MGIPNARRDLYKAADTLFDAVIILKDEQEEVKLRWVQKGVKKIKGEGVVIITWTDDVLKYISQLKSRFTTYKIRSIANLQSGHSIRFNATHARIIKIDDFRSALGLGDKYKQFKILNRDVIKPSIAELNQRSDLTITFDTIKKGRTVAALAFTFTQNKQMKLDV